MKKLEIGAMRVKIDNSWENLDIAPSPIVDIVADISKPLPIEENTYDLIYMSHVLEHIPWYDTVKVLKELCRILKPNGVLEVCVPDFKKIVGVYHKQKIPDGWYMFNPNKDFMAWINGRLYAYYRGEQNWHHAAFDENHLYNCLREAGFSDIGIIEKPRTQGHGWVNLGMSGRKL